jgi:hypothetical protein
MKTTTPMSGAWTTASFGGSAETLPVELSALGDHLGACKGSSGHLFALRCASANMLGFALSRFITTGVAIATLVGIATKTL